MFASGRQRLLPPIPPAARYLIFGIVLAGLVYAMTAMGSGPAAGAEPEPVETVVRVPVLDTQVLAGAHDATREQRLLLEPEPLRHLLQQAIDVGPTVAAALGMPDRMVPVPELRAQAEQWKRRWLFYEGVVEDLAGPRDGNPVPGYGIHEVTIRLADGNAALAAFSLPPDESIHRGSWVRIEGYLLKLRDTTYPRPIDQAPMLVGREIQPDFEDWRPVHALLPDILAKVDDKSEWPQDPMWRDLEEDQAEPLWHLGAFVRDTGSERSLADWRKLGTLNAHDLHDKLIERQIDRGTPLRVFGTLIRRKTIAAPANPAGIAYWTEAWLQVREYGGSLVPIWVPKRVGELPLRANLEVRGHYYRWLAYETTSGERRKAPLFVAADLDLYELETSTTMRTIGVWLGGLTALFLIAILWHQRRTARASIAHARDLDARRRRRRERQPRAAANGQPAS
jgi:hypothetical protein